MNQSTILALAIVFSSVLIVSGTNICDNAPCEPQINGSLGKEFTISLESNPSTGFEWWTNFDPNYLSLLNSTFISGNEKSGMVGVPEKKLFTFNTRSAGKTEVIMLLLRPWENGTIAERKIFPINTMSATEAKQAIILGKSIGGMTTNPMSEGQTTTTTRGTSSNNLTEKSVMETPYGTIPSQDEPSRYELSSLSQRSI
jgi:predicted secreted protein